MPNQAVIKNLPANAGDMDLIPSSGRSPGVWNGNPFQYSCLENTMDRGAWLGCSPWSQSWTWLSTHTCIIRKSKQSASKQVWSLWWWKMSNWPEWLACGEYLPSSGARWNSDERNTRYEGTPTGGAPDCLQSAKKSCPGQSHVLVPMAAGSPGTAIQCTPGNCRMSCCLPQVQGWRDLLSFLM